MTDRIADISDQLIAAFSDHKQKFNVFDATDSVHVEGVPVARLATCTMHTRGNGDVVFEIIYMPEGTAVIQTSGEDQILMVDEEDQDPATLSNEFISHFTSQSERSGNGDVYFTDPEYQDVSVDIAIERDASGNFRPLIMSVTPVGGDAQQRTPGL